MRPGRLTALLVSGVTAASVVPAQAATPTAELGLYRRDGVLWAEALVGEGDAEAVRITFWAPAGPSSERTLWQACRFAFSGAGAYRCGVDVSAGSPARARRGEWMVKVAIDGRVVARLAFRLRT